MNVAAQPPGRLPGTEAPAGARVALRQGGAGLVAIVALAAILRFATLGVQSFSDDELFTAWLVGMPLGDLISTVPESEATPHLFYMLEWLVVQASGTGEVGMRILPALAGTLTVVVIYLTGAIGASRRVGLASAAFVAVNPFLVWFSQEARAYALLNLFVAFTLLALVRFERTGSSRALAGWALASVAALTTHYFALFLIVPEAAWIIASGRHELRRRAAAVALPAVAALALLPLALHQRDAVGDPGGIGGSNLVERLTAVPKNFLVGYSIPAEAVVSALALLAGAALLLLALRAPVTERRLAVSAGLLAAAGVALPLVVAPFGFDYVSSRNVIASLVPLSIALGCGAAVGRRGALALGLLGVLSVFVVVGIALEPKHQRRDWRGAANELGPARTPRALIFSPTFRNFGPFHVYYGSNTTFYTRIPPPVGEIAIVALASSTSFGPGAPVAPGGPAPPAPPGFRLVEDVRTDSYRLVRYVAPSPRAVPHRVMRKLGFRNRRSLVLLQKARP